MKATLGVFGFGQFMEFFTPYLLDTFEVKIYDRSGKKEQIEKLGATSTTIQEAGNCDFVLLGYPASYISKLVQDISPYITSGAVVFDICSVKTPAVSAMQKYLPQDCHIITVHPLFGSQSGKNGIKGLKCTFSKVRCDEEVYQKLKHFFSDTLQLQVFEINSDEHDREIACILGITHFIGRTLKKMQIPDFPIATESYKHLRESSEFVGYVSEDLFFSIQKDNPYTAEVRSKLLEQFNEMENSIQNHNK